MALVQHLEAGNVGRVSTIRIGCAGWSIPRESASHFPTTGTHLQRYAAQFSAVEINSSFYRPHRPQTYARWGASVDQAFRFSVKVPKQITHELRLTNAEDAVATFLDAARALGDQLGCLLVQLPPSLAFEAKVAKAFFRYVRRVYEGPVVCEPRHASWFTANANRLLIDHRVGRVVADPAPVVGADEPGGDLSAVYYRLHGSPRMYYSSYTTEFLTTLADKITSSPASEAETWCIFDNTAAGFATENALQLQLLVAAATGATQKQRRRTPRKH